MEKEDDDATARARSLRILLDHILERFRGDTIIEGVGAVAIVEEVRIALTEEFVLLFSEFTQEEIQLAVLMTFDDSKRLPIHLACDKNAPYSVMQALLEADKDKTSIRQPDKW